MMKPRYRIVTGVLVCSLTAWACGDNMENGGQPDAGPPGDAAPGTSTAFIVSGDFSSGTGVASTLEIPDLEVTVNAVAGVASDDPVLRHHDGIHYIINRFNHDNITRVDAATNTLIDQIQTGPGSNPQDVAVKGSKLYVPALGTAGVVVIDTNDPMMLQTIDLSGLDPNDDTPDCNSVYLVGDSLFVACGILDNFVPGGPAKVAVIDTTDDTLQTSFDLTTENPVGLFEPTPPDGPLGGDLLIATVTFGADLNTGCLERISTGEEPGSNGCLVQNAELGGYASGYAYGPDDTLYLAVTQAFDAMGKVARLYAYDANDGVLNTTPVTPPDQRIFDVIGCPTGEWVLADDAGGIRVYASDRTELTTDLLDIGLPPVDNAMVCF